MQSEPKQPRGDHETVESEAATSKAIRTRDEVASATVMRGTDSKKRARAPRVKTDSEGAVCRVEAESTSELDRAFGTREPDFTKLIMTQLVNVLQPTPSEPVNADKLNAALVV